MDCDVTAPVLSMWQRSATSEEDREKVIQRQRVETNCFVDAFGLPEDVCLVRLERGKKACTDPGERAVLI